MISKIEIKLVDDEGNYSIAHIDYKGYMKIITFNKFIEDSVFYKNEVGAKNKKIVENFYSVEVNYKNYITIFT